MIQQQSRDERLFHTLGYIVVGIMAVICIFPMYLIIVGSFMSNEVIVKYGFSLWPEAFSLDAYRLIFDNPKHILDAYKVTIIVTVCGTLLLLFLCTMTGYVLSRQDYKYRNKFSFYFFFTTIFGGGLVPFYILAVNYLKFKEHPLIAMITPGIFGYFYVIIIRTYISKIPSSITESVKIDGATDFTIYARIIMPISKPILATVGLFSALGFWNDWFNCMLFVSEKKFYNLQYYLYTTLNSVAPMNAVMANANISYTTPPTHTFKLAMTIVTIGPILLLYPFLQKYFIKGIAVGAVKG
jgi:putative aldouronate transport system permease protein